MKAKITKKIWTMAWRNVKRRPRRSLLSMTAIFVAALTMTCLLGLIAGVKVDMAGMIQRYSTGDVLIEDQGMLKSGTQPLALAIGSVTSLVQALKTRPGVAAAAPRITTVASVFRDGNATIFPFMGQDFVADPMKLQEFLVPGGTMPQPGARQALISVGLAQKLNLKTGDTFEVMTQTQRGSSNGMTFTVTGIVKPSLASFAAPWLFTSLATAQRFVKIDDSATGVAISAAPGTDLTKLAADLQMLVKTQGRDTLTSRPWDMTSSTYGLLDYATVIYAIMGLIFFGLASTVIINTMLMVVLERAKEIGMLAALGMDGRDIRGLFLAESAVLSAAGAVAGSLVGCLICLVLSATGLDFTKEMNGVVIADLPGIFHPLLEWTNPVIVITLATAVAVGFTLVPVRRLKKMEIVEALRGEV